jgi:hypothetical protein
VDQKHGDKGKIMNEETYLSFADSIDGSIPPIVGLLLRILSILLSAGLIFGGAYLVFYLSLKPIIKLLKDILSELKSNK